MNKKTADCPKQPAVFCFETYWNT